LLCFIVTAIDRLSIFILKNYVDNDKFQPYRESGLIHQTKYNLYGGKNEENQDTWYRSSACYGERRFRVR
jgi:hypothetical protein